MRELHVLFPLVLCATAVATHASIVPVKGEKKMADNVYLRRQNQILHLYMSPKQREYYSDEFGDFDLKANSNQWSDPEVVNSFTWMFENAYTLPPNGIFTLYEGKIRKFAIKLFDLFYFAKDFDTFFKAACWAKKHLEPVLFNYAFTHALYHRVDCQQFTTPPMYEVFPDYYLPQETIQEIYNAKLLGIKEAKFTLNNTGYEYNYNTDSIAGMIDNSNNNQHAEHKISYFREDVGLNNYYLAWMRKNPGWMTNKKYGKNWFKRGEGFYYTMQQLMTRYTLERLANSLPHLEYLQRGKTISLGYNSKISHIGGQPFIPRPDNIAVDDPDNVYIYEARTSQDRVIDAIYNGSWNYDNGTRVKYYGDNGTDNLGKVIYGFKDFPSSKYYGQFYFKALQALGNIARNKNNVQRNTGVITCPFTTLRDPLYYNFLGTLTYMMQIDKLKLPAYTKTELDFPGVRVKNIEFDKLMTYFEMYTFNVFNAVPVKDLMEYKNFQYSAKQFRLNHKPYNYKITVDSDVPNDAMVRVFIGPKYDAEGHILTLSQRRLAMFELDRFPVKMTAGENVFERNSKDSPIFAQDKEGFRILYEKLEKAKGGSEPYLYDAQRVTCGFPDRFQLPRGCTSGQPFIFTVVVTPFTKRYEGDDKDFYLTCGSPKLYDNRPLGFPFDRTVHEEEFNVANILTNEALIYHNEEVVNN